MIDFLDYLAKATPVFLILAGILGFYYREKIKQVLSHALLKDMETLKNSLNKELADHSAKLQRDVETYKVTLIAEAERVKAAQEVKKSLALRMAERKFNALAGLLDAHMSFDTSIASHVGGLLNGDAAIVEPLFQKSSQELLARFGQYSAACNAANAFLTIEHRQLALAVRNNAIQLLSSRMNYADPAIPQGDPRVQQLLYASIDLETALRALLQEMERLD